MKSRLRTPVLDVLHVATAALFCMLVTSPVARAADGETDLRGLPRAPFTVTRTGTLRESALREVSGMAASRRVDDLIWVHNDSGARAIVHAIGPDGREHARVTVKGATSQDWEDMASFVWNDTPMLVVADIGDNDAKRSVVWLHFFEEPDLGSLEDEEEVDKNVKVDLAWSVPFRLPDGPADCEAVAVDVQSGQVLIMTKRDNPPRLFAVPVAPEGALPARGKVRNAVLLGTVNTIPRPTAADILADPVFGSHSSQPTAMDIAGRSLVVLTYRHGYLFERAPEQSWADALASAPSILALPRMKQSESVMFDRQGRDIFVTSERRGAPVYRAKRALPKRAMPEHENPRAMPAEPARP